MRTGPKTRIIVIRGAGWAFCAETDVVEFIAAIAKAEDADFAEQGIWHCLRYESLFPTHRRSSPWGRDRGGFSYALVADIRIIGLSARINCAFIKIGLAGADMGTSFHLPRLVGACNAVTLM